MNVVQATVYSIKSMDIGYSSTQFQISFCVREDSGKTQKKI